MQNQRKGIISIDFWNTLVDGRANATIRNDIRLSALKKLAGKYDQSIDAERLKRAYKTASDSFDRIWLGEQRTLKTAELVALVLAELDIPASNEEIVELSKVYAESLWEGPPSIADGAKEAIAKLAEHFDLGIISDTMYSPGSVLRVFLDREGLLRHFSAFVFSDEVGYSKPDQRAFDSIREQLSSESAEIAYHIGDLQKTDVKGANNSGFVSLQYVGLNPQEPTEQAKHVFIQWSQIVDFLEAD